MIDAFWVSCVAIFVAELGDKSQLMALAFATRFKAWPVLIGITAATAIVHAASVALGAGLGAALPTDVILIVAGFAFFGFAAWTLRGDKLTDEESAKVSHVTRHAIAAVFVAFLLAELGDKTMLATIALATYENVWGVWLGSTVGMVAADALAIIVGQRLGKHLPERAIRIGASISFVVFGVLLIADGLTG